MFANSFWIIFGSKTFKLPLLLRRYHPLTLIPNLSVEECLQKNLFFLSHWLMRISSKMQQGGLPLFWRWWWFLGLLLKQGIRRGQRITPYFTTTTTSYFTQHLISSRTFPVGRFAKITQTSHLLMFCPVLSWPSFPFDVISSLRILTSL